MRGGGAFGKVETKTETQLHKYKEELGTEAKQKRGEEIENSKEKRRV